ncbi:LysR family transcriptional regulator [Chitinilyticum piscinae]|uniref:LysR family transcriptional regulator n=1 Tax=Chitinilyticum piscinae TaxID=2866724 RepID=A0A8J7FIM3_9NEIS|nr:LysR family transcriptional regulator [Chitinilyticum piscinae]MBE9608112.1 LysR family transcriptional regulator [Chitinilyticum piscinae]
MIANTQSRLTAADLALVLALVRGAKLAGAGERLGLDASTVFRSLQRLERELGQPLFVRHRRGYQPGELALALAAQAEQIEAALDAAHATLQQQPAHVAGTVRITSTDTILHGLLAPALASLRATHPLLEFDLHTGNELASLTRRDADLAVRATRSPPAHLVGRCLGSIRVALYCRQDSRWQHLPREQADWIAPDDALPEHPSVIWRKKHYPQLRPAYRVGSIQSVLELVAADLGIGLLPMFFAASHPELRAISAELPECRTELWLLAHPESRHLRRISTVYSHLAEAISLP